MVRARHVNPYTDFGFKKIFGEEASLPLLKSFLNSLLPENDQIETLQFRNSEFLGQNIKDRKAIFDLYCQNERGEKFIVELQKAKQNHFVDRSVYYATFPIQEQAKQGDWDYKLKAVYCIGILDFVFSDYLASDEQKGRTKHTVQFKNDDNLVITDKLTFIYLEMPNFKKGLDALETLSDKWFYFLKHLEDLDSIPEVFKKGEQGEIFEQAFKKASIAKLTTTEREFYERSLKSYRDMYSVFKTARDEGLEEGIEQGLEQGIAQGLEQGLEQGVERGRSQGLEEALQSMINSGMPETQARDILKFYS